MELPSYFLTRPPLDLDPDTIADFERLYADMLASDPTEPIAYYLAAPKWKFLAYLTDTKNILMHGSNSADIEEFEPRQSNDAAEFGNRRAVYAASDALWSMFFAIVARHSAPSGTINAAIQVVAEDGTKSPPYYYFAIDDTSYARAPWQQGTLYILPRDTFEQQPPQVSHGMRIEAAHWASLVPVKPLGKITLEPTDFPFLDRILPFNPTQVMERAKKNPEGFPWMED